MQFRRAALPLCLLALLTSTGCVPAGPGERAAGAAPGSPPPVGAADTPPAAPPPPALPLSPLPDAGPRHPAPDTGPDAAGGPKQRPRTRPARRGGEHAAKPAVPRHPAHAPRGEELCAAAQGVVPPSVVDLCVRQYTR
ncbi:hypothetical protein [Streptomyces sp. NPDC054838]